jgi:hypothetical protein
MEYVNLFVVISALVLYVLIIAACLCYIQQRWQRKSYSR